MMTTQQKSFGSLSGSLLARKGGARPAMRPQAFRFDEGDETAAEDECGWNDMGRDMLTPEQRESLLPAENGNIRSIVAAQPVPAEEESGDEPAAAQTEAETDAGIEPANGTNLNGHAAADGGIDADHAAERGPVAEQHRALADSLGAELEEANGHTLAEDLSGNDDDAEEQAAFLARLEADTREGTFEEEAAPRREPGPASEASARPRSAPGSKAKAAFTLRLDRDLHLKLRLACAFQHTSAQKLVTEALSEYLDRHHPDLPVVPEGQGD
ncbi:MULTISPECIES: hypothetical protein [Pacificimonas]|nr:MULTISPECIES: hypothetical protein [Pacificimonas]MBZ6378385.1 hypothetical protein [Pacificimonas aurantium]